MKAYEYTVIREYMDGTRQKRKKKMLSTDLLEIGKLYSFHIGNREGLKPGLYRILSLREYSAE